MGIKICPDCGGKVSEALSSCPHCGYNFSATILCPGCFAEVSKTAPECPFCGHVFFEADDLPDVSEEVDDSDLELPEDDNDYDEVEDGEEEIEVDEEEETDEEECDDDWAEDEEESYEETEEEESTEESQEEYVEVIVEREKSSACSDIETVVSVDDYEIVTVGNGEQSSFLVKPGIRNFTISKGKNGPKFTSITEACQHYEIIPAGPVTIKFVVRTKFGAGNFVDITSIEQED